MRAIPILVAAATLAGCMTQPPAPTRTAEGQAKLQRLIAGKVAKAPVTCLSSLRTRNSTTIDNSTIAFRTGQTVYVNHLRGACSQLDSNFYTLVTRSSGSGLCSGDIADVTDLRSGMIVGSCALGEFVPYTRG